MDSAAESNVAALDRARGKAYWRLLPLLFVCYVIAYVDRTNVSIAKLTMSKDLPAFDNGVIGLGAGMFFIGYFLLEIPGTLLVERWSARLWISRIMITWGIISAMTAWVKTPMQFYVIRFLLGLAEAGFFPGVIVYLTHWFPKRDRAKALAFFFVATPMAQMVSPKISNLFLKVGMTEVVDGVTIHHPQWLGLQGWQLIYILWGIPAVVLGFVVLGWLTDRPRDARWLTDEERAALEEALARSSASTAGHHRMTVGEALRHPKVLGLSAAYFFTVTGSYGVEFFLPSILDKWYKLNFNALTWLVILPPIVAVLGQLCAGWSSDRTKERRFHTIVPIVAGAIALGLTPLTQGNLTLTVICFMVAFAGFKSYMPAFWSLPTLFLSDAAAAGSIGLINSVGNLGGFCGPTLVGKIEQWTGSFSGAMYTLAGSMLVSATIVVFLGLGGKERHDEGTTDRPKPA